MFRSLLSRCAIGVIGFSSFLPWADKPVRAGGCSSGSCSIYSHRKVVTPVAVAVVPTVVTITVPATTFQFVPAVETTTTTTATTTAATTAITGQQIALPPGESLPTENLEANATVTRSGLVIASDGESEAIVDTPQFDNPARLQQGANAGNFAQVLSNRCASCHTGASSSGGFVIFSSPGKLAPAARDKLQLSYMALLADMAVMPPKAKGNVKSPSAATNNEVLSMKQEVIRLKKGGK